MAGTPDRQTGEIRYRPYRASQSIRFLRRQEKERRFWRAVHSGSPPPMDPWDNFVMLVDVLGFGPDNPLFKCEDIKAFAKEERG